MPPYTLGMRFLSILITSLLVSSAFSQTDPRAIEEQDRFEAEVFWDSLTQGEREVLFNLETKIQGNLHKTSIVRYAVEEKRVNLFIKGMGPDLYAWHYPLHRALLADETTFFLNWSHRSTLSNNLEIFQNAIKEIKRDHPAMPIRVFGFSAGGVIMAYALAGKENKDLRKNVYLHAIASPFEGYKAPSVFARIGKIFGAPATAVELGIGLGAKIRKLNSTAACFNWISTNCELDIHACPKKRIYPQVLGELNLDDSNERKNLICGQNNYAIVNTQSHPGMLKYVIDEVFSQ